MGLAHIKSIYIKEKLKMKTLTNKELFNVCGAVSGYEFRFATQLTPSPRPEIGTPQRSGIEHNIGVPTFKWTRIELK